MTSSLQIWSASSPDLPAALSGPLVMKRSSVDKTKLDKALVDFERELSVVAARGLDDLPGARPIAGALPESKWSAAES